MRVRWVVDDWRSTVNLDLIMIMLFSAFFFFLTTLHTGVARFYFFPMMMDDAFLISHFCSVISCWHAFFFLIYSPCFLCIDVGLPNLSTFFFSLMSFVVWFWEVVWHVTDTCHVFFLPFFFFLRFVFVWFLCFRDDVVVYRRKSKKLI